MKKIIMTLATIPILLCGCSFNSNGDAIKYSSKETNSFYTNVEETIYGFNEKYAAYKTKYPGV